MDTNSARQPFPHFSRDDILNLVGPVLFERGLDYYEIGMVERITWDGTILRGVVRGTSESFYQVAIRHTESGSRAYHHAVGYMRQVKKLLAASGRMAEWEKLSNEIKAEHGRKHSFMRFFEKL